MTLQTTLSPSEDEVVGALLALSRAFVGVTARALNDIDEDVTLAQFRTLVVLASRGPQRVVDLAQELAAASSTAVRMCNRLVVWVSSRRKCTRRTGAPSGSSSCAPAGSRWAT